MTTSVRSHVRLVPNGRNHPDPRNDGQKVSPFDSAFIYNLYCADASQLSPANFQEGGTPILDKPRQCESCVVTEKEGSTENDLTGFPNKRVQKTRTQSDGCMRGDIGRKKAQKACGCPVMSLLLRMVYEILHLSCPLGERFPPVAATADACVVSACWMSAAMSLNTARHCGHTSLPAALLLPLLLLEVESIDRDAVEPRVAPSGCALFTWAISWDTYANFFWQIGHSSEFVVIRFADAALAVAAAAYGT